MKAWRVHAWGEPETMTLEDVALPAPGAGEVRIRNHAAGLNFFDILQVQGKYQIKPPFPFTPGAEVAGIVDAVGADATKFSIGDRVLSITHGGAMAEYSIGRVGMTFPIPAGMDFPEAAAFPIVVSHVVFLTARARSAESRRMAASARRSERRWDVGYPAWPCVRRPRNRHCRERRKAGIRPILRR
jgi:NADPH:quinone reductase-like Zn-dependent oxidoreductase